MQAPDATHPHHRGPQRRPRIAARLPLLPVAVSWNPAACDSLVRLAMPVRGVLTEACRRPRAAHSRRAQADRERPTSGRNPIQRSREHHDVDHGDIRVAVIARSGSPTADCIRSLPTVWNFSVTLPGHHELLATARTGPASRANTFHKAITLTHSVDGPRSSAAMSGVANFQRPFGPTRSNRRAAARTAARRLRLPSAGSCARDQRVRIPSDGSPVSLSGACSTRCRRRLPTLLRSRLWTRRAAFLQRCDGPPFRRRARCARSVRPRAVRCPRRRTNARLRAGTP